MLQILMLDNHLLALDKPAGLLTQPSGSSEDSLESHAKAWLKEHFNRPGNVFLEAVHRIDKPACGIVLFARSSKGLSRLNAAVRDRLVRKVYRCRVEGRLKQSAGRLEDFLLHDEHRSRVVSEGTPGARLACLSYKVLETGANGSLLEIILETGRYHQIRVQLAHLGNPILGDVKYGSTKSHWQKDAIALQHFQLTFPHPIGGREITLQSEFRI
ncbi:MAG: RNA pseudouridine synthase [Lentisphaerae bacterium]|nr:RNA pseudouridine synthase [Lentisphaerota bacterium]